MQLFFAIMCISAFSFGYCILSKFRKRLRDEFLADGFAATGEELGIQLEVTSYDDDAEVSDETTSGVVDSSALTVGDQIEGSVTKCISGERDNEFDENEDETAPSSSAIVTEERQPLR
jgi:hypothetical protein